MSLYSAKVQIKKIKGKKTDISLNILSLYKI